MPGGADDSGHDARFDGLDDMLDRSTFEQLMELDEEDLEFSHSMVESFFRQADESFVKLEEAIEQGNFATISTLGHFLKGSAAAVGFTKVRKYCEQLEHIGGLGKGHFTVLPEEKKVECMKAIREDLKGAKASCAEIKPLMQSRFFSHFES